MQDKLAQPQLEDTQIVHAAPGEMVVPPVISNTTQQLINRDMQAVGLNPQEYVVGNGEINQLTGLQQFGFLSKIFKKVKNVVNHLKKRKIPEGHSHTKVYRPWGHYLSVVEDNRWQVKLIQVKPGEKLSLQMHHHRSEHWVVVSGTAKVEVDSKVEILSENQSVYIPLGSKHRLSNPGKIFLTLIEVQSGSYVGEDDIVRFEDKYGR